MAIPQLKVWTYGDYAALPEDGKRYEVIEGELTALPGPNRRHQQILLRLSRILADYVEVNALGEIYLAPFDVLLSLSTIVQPDVLFISTANAGVLTDLNVQGPPDLCIEILSPGTRTHDLGQKRDLYAKFGVREYWIVDAEAQGITMYVAKQGTFIPLGVAAGETTIASAAVAGFVLDARPIFR